MIEFSKKFLTLSAAVLFVLPFALPQGAVAATSKAKRVCNKGFCPAAVSITKGADEKNFSNPTTRCLTKDIKAMYDKAKAQMQDDVERFGKDKDVLNSDYQQKIEIGWNAMHEDYCGYGSNGLQSVKHSLDKTYSRARADYLENVGARKVAKL